jgi:hypothetical protein
VRGKPRAHQDSDAARAYDALGGRVDALVGPLRQQFTGETNGSDTPAETERVAAGRTDDAALEATGPDGTGFGFVTDTDDEPTEARGRTGRSTSSGRSPRGTEETGADDADVEGRIRGDGRGYVADDESLRGTDGVFRPVYADADCEKCDGWACACGNVDLAVDPSGRLECEACGNTSRATRWDTAQR